MEPWRIVYAAVCMHAATTPLPVAICSTHKVTLQHLDKLGLLPPAHQALPCMTICSIPHPQAAIAKVGAHRFYTDLFLVGLLYHLYNQV